MWVMDDDDHPRGAWFGEPWPDATHRAPVCDDDTCRVPVPVGQTCLLCSEVIQDGNRGTFMGAVIEVDGNYLAGTSPAHIECSHRAVVGNHLHVAGRCQHIGDCVEHSTLTYRQEALAVWRYHMILQGIGPYPAEWTVGQLRRDLANGIID